jgi:hypothetical protein
VAAVLNDPALLLKQRGDLAGAEVMFRESLRSTQNRASGPSTAMTPMNSAACCRTRATRGRRALLRQSLEIRRAQLGRIIRTWLGLEQPGVAPPDAPDLCRRRAAVRESVAIRRKLLGNQHPTSR